MIAAPKCAWPDGGDLNKPDYSITELERLLRAVPSTLSGITVYPTRPNSKANPIQQS